jgi:hypothetical protein
VSFSRGSVPTGGSASRCATPPSMSGVRSRTRTLSGIPRRLHRVTGCVPCRYPPTTA